MAFGPKVRLSDWWTILKAAVSLIFKRVDADTWRDRMRVCYDCPFYDRDKRVCPGCGCYAPSSNLLDKKACWGRDEMGEAFGWGDEGKA